MFFRRKERNPVPPGAKLQRGLRLRLLVVKVFLLAFFVLIAWRLAQIQIVEAPKYQEIARRQYEARMSLPAAKGNIYDRNGNVLVSNSMFVSFAADPKVVGDDAKKVAEIFSRVFGKARKSYLERLNTSKRFVWLERRVTPDIAERLKEQELDGVVALQEPKRLYHYDEVAGSLLGFTDIDNRGLSGLELQFDEQIRGTDGFVILQKDGLGKRKPSVTYPRVEPVPGANLHLTIDLAYQSIAEEELQRGVKKAKADGGVVAAMNPRTGEILALAQYPGLNPNEVGRYAVQNQKLRLVTDMFEPGSIFKLVTAAAALEENLVQPDQIFFGENGEYRIPLRNGRVRMIKDTHEHGWISFQHAMEVSSNIVMVKASDLIGPERLYRKAKELGFGLPTGIQVPGEIRGELKKPSAWSTTSLSTISYGYEVGATPIQLLVAYAAVANGGLLLKPTLVKKIVSPRGATIEESRPQIVRRAFPEETANILVKFFEGVVERGTGTQAKLEGIRVAGKTGTARKNVDGRYQTGSYTASFVGFFPVEDPQVICLVVLDNPRGGSYFGGQVAAPVFRSVAQRIVSSSFNNPGFRRETVITKSDSDPTLVVPDFRNTKAETVQRLLAERGVKSELLGEGEIVVNQSPKPGTRIEDGDKVSLFVSERTEEVPGGYVETPDLRGLSLRRAMNRLAIDRLAAKVHGSGVVKSQNPLPGEMVKLGTKVYINCEPRMITIATD